jgi:hypothetical protein
MDPARERKAPTVVGVHDDEVVDEGTVVPSLCRARGTVMWWTRPPTTRGHQVSLPHAFCLETPQQLLKREGNSKDQPQEHMRYKRL